MELDTLEASATECYLGEQVRVSATKPGTYTVSGTFNGEDKGTVQIKVTEKPQKVNVAEETGTFPIVPVAVGGGAALILAATLVFVCLEKRWRK